MQEDLKRVGEILKSKRKEMNLSLKEIENGTSIRSNYLEAIEEGTIKDHIAGIYAQGFLKQYASFLGLEIDQLIKENPGAFHQIGEKHEFAYGIGTLEVRSNQNSSMKWIPNILWGSIAIIILAIAWYLAKYLGVV